MVFYLIQVINELSALDIIFLINFQKNSKEWSKEITYLSLSCFWS